jgi:hypothetical protein
MATETQGEYRRSIRAAFAASRAQFFLNVPTGPLL